MLEYIRAAFVLHIQCESLNSECEALKEKVEELTIDLEILKNEISESGTLIKHGHCVVSNIVITECTHFIKMPRYKFHTPNFFIIFIE